MLNHTKLNRLKTIFTGYPEIEGVYLFGSASTGKNHDSSDLDLGIVYNDASITEKKLHLYTDLIRVGVENADIVFFNDADLVLQFEIIRHNQLIYRTEDFNHGELFSITIRKYFDIEPYLRRQRKAIKERILNG